MSQTPSGKGVADQAAPSTRAGLAGWTATPLKTARSHFTPDVIMMERGGYRAVLKCSAGRPWWARLLWTRGCVGREWNSLMRLAATGIAPRPLVKLDHDGFLMEWLDAAPLPKRGRGDDLPVEFFRSLPGVFARMHAAGVAQGDVRRRNIMRAADGTARLVDFETAVLDGTNPLRRAAFRLTARIDRLTVLKIVARECPEALDDTQRAELARVPWPLRVGRWLRHTVYPALGGGGMNRGRIRRRLRDARKKAGRKP